MLEGEERGYQWHSCRLVSSTRARLVKRLTTLGSHSAVLVRACSGSASGWPPAPKLAEDLAVSVDSGDASEHSESGDSASDDSIAEAAAFGAPFSSSDADSDVMDRGIGCVSEAEGIRQSWKRVQPGTCRDSKGIAECLRYSSNYLQRWIMNEGSIWKRQDLHS